MADGLFVVSDVEEARMPEDFRRIGDHLGAHPVIWGGRHHVTIVLHPAVVGVGKVEFGDDFHAQRIQAADFVAHLLDAPAAFDGQFRVARILESFAKVDDQHVDTVRGCVIRHFPPQGIHGGQPQVGAFVFRQQFDRLLQVASHRLDGPVAPHIVAETDVQGPDVADGGLEALREGVLLLASAEGEQHHREE